MAAGRIFGFGVIGALLGAVAGGLLALGGGLAWTEINQTSGFEGYAGHVVVAWTLIGIIAGLVAGAVRGVIRGRRPGSPAVPPPIS